MYEPTIVRMEGPPAGHKTAMVRILKEYAESMGLTVYINEEDGHSEYGSKNTANIQIYTKQINV